MSRKIIEVAAAILSHNGRILVCSRPRHTALASFWEFPGGKLEPGETHRQALVREIREELSVEVEPGDPFWRLEHDYGDKYVRVMFFFASPRDPERFRIVPNDDQETAWVGPDELIRVPFLPADAPVAAALHFFWKKNKNILQ